MSRATRLTRAGLVLGMVFGLLALAPRAAGVSAHSGSQPVLASALGHVSPARAGGPSVGVVVARALGARQTPLGVATSFPASTRQVYCVATFARLLPSDAVAFHWVERSPQTAALITYHATSQGAVTTNARLYSFLSFEQGGKPATFSPGAYSCDVSVNGITGGSARFTVQ